MEELGGLFANLQLDDDEIRQDLERIYAEFCRDPDCELKLNKPHMWYASPVIDDYYFKREKNLCNLTWIRDVLTLRFFHARNPKVDVRLVALNLGDPIILKELGLLYFTDVGEQLTKIQRLQTLVKEMRDISYIVEMVKMDDVSLLPIIRESLKEHYDKYIFPGTSKDYNVPTDFGDKILERYNKSYLGLSAWHPDISINQWILTISAEVEKSKIYDHLVSRNVYTSQIIYAWTYSNLIPKFAVYLGGFSAICLKNARDLSICYGCMESFNILQKYIVDHLPSEDSQFSGSLCIYKDLIDLFNLSKSDRDDAFQIVYSCVKNNAIKIFERIMSKVPDEMLRDLNRYDYGSSEPYLLPDIFAYQRTEILQIYLQTLKDRGIAIEYHGIDEYNTDSYLPECKPLFAILNSMTNGRSNKWLNRDVNSLDGYDEQGLYNRVHYGIDKMYKAIEIKTTPIKKILEIYYYFVVYRDDKIQSRILTNFKQKLKPLVSFIRALDKFAPNEKIKALIKDLKNFERINWDIILCVLADYDKKDLFEKYIGKYNKRNKTINDLHIAIKFIAEDDTEYLDLMCKAGDFSMTHRDRCDEPGLDDIMEIVVYYSSHKVYKKYLWGTTDGSTCATYHLYKYKPKSKLAKYVTKNWKEILSKGWTQSDAYDELLVPIMHSGNIKVIKTFIDCFEDTYSTAKTVYEHASPEMFRELMYYTDKTGFELESLVQEDFMDNWMNGEIILRDHTPLCEVLIETDDMFHVKKKVELVNKYRGFGKFELVKRINNGARKSRVQEYLKSILEDGVYFENL